MREKGVLILGLLVSMYFLRLGGILSYVANAPVEYLVHNLNTGLSYATVQEAIDANETSGGHTILVEEGIYNESVCINKSITLTGQRASNTIIDGGLTHAVIRVEANGVKIDNLTVICPIANADMVSLTNVRNCTVEGSILSGYTAHGGTVDTGIIFTNCTDCSIVQNVVSDKGMVGIALDNCTNCKIVGNSLARNYWGGIWMEHCSNCEAIDNNLEATSVGGLDVRWSQGCIISRNRLFESSFLLYSSSDCAILWNYIFSRNDTSIQINFSTNCTVIGNTMNRSGYSVPKPIEGILDTTGCRFHHNNVVNCDFVMSNVFDIALDDGLEGNYWSLYNGTDADSNGIGDTSHEVNGIVDHYPLMGMAQSFDVSYHSTMIITNSTISDFQYYEFNGTIRFDISNSTQTQDFGFCRICIPHEIMNVTNISITIDRGNTTVLHAKYNLHDNGTHRWIYFAYQRSAHEVIIIPEFLLPTVPLLTTVMLVVTIVRRRKTPLDQKLYLKPQGVRTPFNRRST